MISVEQAMFEWSDEYNIGVKNIDDAHKQLFSIVSRILRNITDANFEKNKMTCIEAIKYLKSYTIKHFTEEEAYQLSIGYPGYKMHKRVHDNMREVVVPALEREMVSSCYSKESMEHFIGACTGWLMAHVLVDDQAITGKSQNKWVKHADDRSIEDLENIMKNIIHKLCNTPATLVSKHYHGYELKELFCCSDKFVTESGEIYIVNSAVEKNVMSNVLSNILDKKVLELTGIMLPLVIEISSSFHSMVMEGFMPDVRREGETAVIRDKDFYDSFKPVYPEYSMLWRTEYGYLAFTMNRVQR